VYSLLRDGLPAAARAISPAQIVRSRAVPRNVVMLGLTSLFTDISSEMVSAILPLYLILALGASPLVFGIVDGIYNGASALVRVGAGLVADGWGRHKQVAVAGYGISALSRLGLLVAGAGWLPFLGLIIVDRTGKGIRTAPRDALISLSTRPEHLGVAFGVHRALDTAGALIGPLVAFAILIALPRGFDLIFLASFCAAVIGLAILVLFVDGRTALVPRARLRLRDIGRTARAPWMLPLLGAAALLSVVTVSDAFIYLLLQRRAALAVGFFPLLFVATSIVYMLLAVPAGRVADRRGRRPMVLAGYALLVPLYASLLLADAGPLTIVAAVVLLGAHYAATDGVLMAIASARIPPELRGTGLAAVTTVTSLGRLVASVLFGVAWSLWGPEAAIAAFAAAMCVAIAGASRALAAVR